jgi:hypothetical protein
MKFEWDEQKNLANIEKHNLDFETRRKSFDFPCGFPLIPNKTMAKIAGLGLDLWTVE